MQWQLALEALTAWGHEHDIDPERLALRPEDLGIRITYLASDPVTETSVPYCDFAVPFAWPLSTSVVSPPEGEDRGDMQHQGCPLRHRDDVPRPGLCDLDTPGGT